MSISAIDQFSSTAKDWLLEVAYLMAARNAIKRYKQMSGSAKFQSVSTWFWLEMEYYARGYQPVPLDALINYAQNNSPIKQHLRIQRDEDESLHQPPSFEFVERYNRAEKSANLQPHKSHAPMGRNPAIYP